MIAARKEHFLAIFEKVFWILFLVSLPLTSFPYLPPMIGGGALVRPLSLYPLIVLLILATLPRLLRKPVPGTVLSLLPFILLALISSLLSFLRGIDPALGISVFERVLRAVITLGIGCAIYLTVVLMPRKQEDLRSTIRWIYAGFSLALLWGSLQAVYIIHFNQDWFGFMNRIQRHISIRRLFPNRVSGLTYEPNWFAEQLSLLLLPWLLASVLTGYSVFKWRWRRVTIEWFLLAWMVLVLAFTFSRAGVLNVFALAVVAILIFRFQASENKSANRNFLMRLGRLSIEIIAVVVILAGITYFAGSKNEFFARIWNYWEPGKNVSISGYLKYLGFSARFTYSETAMNIYEENPLFGVGLGNYAFYFDEMLPERPLALTPEVLRIVTPDKGANRLITPKNFYTRLLAETGIIGAAGFAVFFIAVFGCSLYLWFSASPDSRYWGMAGIFALITLLLSAFSFDSFAIPNMWVVFGLITSAAWIYSRDENNQILNPIGVTEK